MIDDPLMSADFVPTAFDATDILDTPQFTSEDVCRVVEITAKQLEHAIDPARSVIRVSPQSRQRRQGRRRMFTGGDVLKVAVLFATNATGFPMRFAATMADQVESRAGARLVGFDMTPGLIWLTWPFKDGSDWNLVPVWEGRQDPPHTPASFLVIEVDRLIDETLAKLKAVVEGEPIPDFSIPDHEPEPSSLSPENDFFLRWAKDDQGRDVLVGLTFEETQEHQRGAQDRRSVDPVNWLALEQKHETARLARMSETYDARLQARLGRSK
jgi:hypothetical protein